MSTQSPQSPHGCKDGGGASAPADAQSSTCSTRQVLLGVFIVGHLLFLLAANFLNGLHAAGRMTGSDEIGAVVDHLSGGIGKDKGHWHEVYYLLGRWENILSQNQNWRMFSPYVNDGVAFVRVEIRWDDHMPGSPAAAGAPPPVFLRGVNEPADLNNFVRWGPWRFQRYEDYFMGLDLRIGADETPEQAQARWKNMIAHQVGWEWPTINAYLNWRWRKYREEHPEAAEPAQLILLVNCYVIAPPDEAPGTLIGPNVVPIARWQPQKAPLPGRAPEGAAVVAGTYAAIQPWDPQANQWISRE